MQCIIWSQNEKYFVKIACTVFYLSFTFKTAFSPFFLSFSFVALQLPFNNLEKGSEDLTMKIISRTWLHENHAKFAFPVFLSIFLYSSTCTLQRFQERYSRSQDNGYYKQVIWTAYTRLTNKNIVQHDIVHFFLGEYIFKEVVKFLYLVVKVDKKVGITFFKLMIVLCKLTGFECCLKIT